MNCVTARRTVATGVAIGLATLALTACSSSSRGVAAAAASATGASTTSSTAVVATTSATTAVASSASAGPSSGAAKAAPNPCALVTSADLSAALGSSVPAGIHQQAGLFDACVYPDGSAVILVRSTDQATFDRSAKANPGGATPVTGVGDDAYNASGNLLVWQAGTEIALKIAGGSSDALTIEKRLAAVAVARL